MHESRGFARLCSGEERCVVDFDLVERDVRVDICGDREAALPDENRRSWPTAAAQVEERGAAVA